MLSVDPFWTSILQSSTHPLRSQLHAKLCEIFSRKFITDEWMKGSRSSEEIISAMGIWLDRRFRQDFLTRRLRDDCSHMRVNVELCELLRNVKSRTFVVLATDNMDCFARTFDEARNGRRLGKQRTETLITFAMLCDDILCSSEIGALKAENPVNFFGAWLFEHGLRFSNALLVDDRADNCAAFRQHGGSAIQWKMGKSEVSELARSLNRWLNDSLPTADLMPPEKMDDRKPMKR